MKTHKATFHTDWTQQIWWQYKKNVYKKLLTTMNFSVIPKGIWVQESLGTGGTCQPYPQMISAHMCTDGSLQGWRSLTAPLNLAFVNPLDVPKPQVKGYHVGGNGHLQSIWDSWGGSLWWQFNLLNHRSRDLRCSSFRLLRGWLRNGGRWSIVVVFGWGGIKNMGGMRYSSPQEPVQTLCLWSCHCWFNFLKPLCVQLLHLLP